MEAHELDQYTGTELGVCVWRGDESTCYEVRDSEECSGPQCTDQYKTSVTFFNQFTFMGASGKKLPPPPSFISLDCWALHVVIVNLGMNLFQRMNS